MTRELIKFAIAGFAASMATGCGDAGSDAHHIPAVPEEDQLTPFENPKPVFSKADWEAMSQGQRVYERSCAHCHDPGTGPHSGTQMLALSRGEDSAEIRKSANLTPEYVQAVVRNGLQMMPAFRTTEISDEEVAAVAGYVTQGTDQ